MNVLIAGGGTGGHLFPGIAVAQELRKTRPHARILFVGTARGIEVRAVPRAGFDLALLPVSGLRRTGFFGLVRGLLLLPLALFKAVALVLRFKPQVAVSVGGYAAGPAVLASRILGVPCAVMEQNAIPGLTNKVLGKMSQTVFAALPSTAFDPQKLRVVGNPVRSDFVPVRSKVYTPHEIPQILVFGGSQGARAINEVMMDLAPLIAERQVSWKIIHQTGKHDHERVAKAYSEAGADTMEAVPFIDDMAVAYERADLVVSRAGATTIAELTVCGRPAILVPFPSAVDDHQTKNARTLERSGAAVLVPQPKLSAPGLLDLLSQLLNSHDRLVAMAQAARECGHPDAAKEIADGLAELADVDGGADV